MGQNITLGFAHTLHSDNEVLLFDIIDNKWTFGSNIAQIQHFQQVLGQVFCCQNWTKSTENVNTVFSVKYIKVNLCSRTGFEIEISVFKNLNENHNLVNFTLFH